jgi:hypothetical protein
MPPGGCRARFEIPARRTTAARRGLQPREGLRNSPLSHPFGLAFPRTAPRDRSRLAGACPTSSWRCGWRFAAIEREHLYAASSQLRRPATVGEHRARRASGAGAWHHRRCPPAPHACALDLAAAQPSLFSSLTFLSLASGGPRIQGLSRGGPLTGSLDHRGTRLSASRHAWRSRGKAPRAFLLGGGVVHRVAGAPERDEESGKCSRSLIIASRKVHYERCDDRRAAARTATWRGDHRDDLIRDRAADVLPPGLEPLKIMIAQIRDDDRAEAAPPSNVRSWGWRASPRCGPGRSARREWAPACALDGHA